MGINIPGIVRDKGLSEIEKIVTKYSSDIHEEEYQKRPLPRRGERGLVDRDGRAGLLVRDGTVGIMGRGGAAFNLSDNIVGRAHRLKFEGDFVLAYGAVRLKGSLRSSEKLSEIGLDAEQIQITGDQVVLGNKKDGSTFIEGKRLLLGRGSDMVRIGDRSVKRIVIVGRAIELFGSTTINGATRITGSLRVNGSYAKLGGPPVIFPPRPAPNFPLQPKKMSDEKDPEADKEVESVAAARMLANTMKEE